MPQGAASICALQQQQQQQQQQQHLFGDGNGNGSVRTKHYRGDCNEGGANAIHTNTGINDERNFVVVVDSASIDLNSLGRQGYHC
jgi:hypothetical protein